MKHTLETIEKALVNHWEHQDAKSYEKLKAEVVGCKKELREMTLRKSRFDKPNMDFVQMIRTSLIKEILGEGGEGGLDT